MRNGTTLAVRLDSAGDLLLMGPALRAMARQSGQLALLAGPRAGGVVPLLPGIDRAIIWHAPWIDPDPEPLEPASVAALIDEVRALEPERAVIFTSFHQSALVTAFVLRLAGVPWIAAISDDYPGSLLDVRHRLEEDIHEVERARSLAAAAGFSAPPDDDGRLSLRTPLPDVHELLLPLEDRPYVVVHPGTSAPARAWDPVRYAETIDRLSEDGWGVVVTGAHSESMLADQVAGLTAVNLAGRTDWAHAAAVMAGAQAVVVGNTGPAHLAAAVATPVVSVFAPTVPAIRWAPYGVPTVLLGDASAKCAGCRAIECPMPGHPCLAAVTAQDVVAAVEHLAGGGQ